MAKKASTKKTVATAKPEVTESSEHELYYRVDHLEMCGTFTNCTINVNVGKPGDPPTNPPGGNG